ncbi:unnamed protein product [Brachionus calyciflorus]|uniref:Uncharacterized protein n=1 Tax=Brachionus calyciflorus TaxID=104777 RepID=A0A814F822_9BILA|nr:unnamed protein product [Brachionus calyciflorus]
MLEYKLKLTYVLSQFSIINYTNPDYTKLGINGVSFVYPYIFNVLFCIFNTEQRSYIYYYILVNNEIKFDHNIIGLEFHALEAGSFLFELGTISCYPLCSDYFEDYGGLDVKFKSYYTRKIIFVNGSNIVYFENKINAWRDSYVQISFSTGKLVSISGTKKGTFRYYRYPCTTSNTHFGYTEESFAFLFKTITENNYYKGFTQFQYRYESTGDYKMILKQNNYYLTTKSDIIKAINVRIMEINFLNDDFILDKILNFSIEIITDMISDKHIFMDDKESKILNHYSKN